MAARTKNKARHKILIVDDEPDIHTLTRMSLKSLRYQDMRLKFLSASSGAEALEALRQNQDIAVVLLDVVMETEHAGLDTCQAIREELGNYFVRILMRTGQPGMAPEKKTIETYDIDGYLPKAELTSNRLFTAVRTAIKAYRELVTLERHRNHLAAVHQCAISLVAFAPLEETLPHILDTVADLCPDAPLVALQLETFEEQGNPREFYLYQRSESGVDVPARDPESLPGDVRQFLRDQPSRSAGPAVGGYLVPLSLHRELGYGWIYVQVPQPDELTMQTLPLLASHMANALYASVAQEMLRNREGDVFDSMDI